MNHSLPQENRQSRHSVCSRSIIGLVTASLLPTLACGASSKPVTAVGNTVESPAPVADQTIYQTLFTEGKKWSFTLVRRTSTYGDTDRAPMPQDVPMGQLTCTVEKALTTADRKAAAIACTYGEDGTQGSGQVAGAPAGVWMSNDQGLWWFEGYGAGRLQEFVTTPLKKEQMVFAKVAAAHHREQTTGDGMDIYNAELKDGKWCMFLNQTAGDEAGWETCMTAEKGFVSGGWFTAGGTTIDYQYK
jgi:hypothetical protein